MEQAIDQAMNSVWCTQVVNALLQAAAEHGEGALAFRSEEQARVIAALAGFMRLGVRDGHHYDIQASQVDPIKDPHLWQVTVKRREEDYQP